MCFPIETAIIRNYCEWMVRCRHHVCVQYISEENYIRHFKWLIKRQVKVRNWIVDGDVAKLCSPPIIERLAGPHVRSLHLRFLSAERTVTVFSTLAMACSGIQALRIENCEYWETLSVLGEATLQTLQKLVLESCGTHDCESYPQFTNLQTLHVGYLGGVGVKQSVTSLLKAAPNLTDLRLSSRVSCPISDESLHMLSNHAAGLEVLELTMEHQEFTPAAVVSLAVRCRNLKTLVLLYGDGISDAARGVCAPLPPTGGAAVMWRIYCCIVVGGGHELRSQATVPHAGHGAV
jgi:hypothetical protein